MWDFFVFAFVQVQVQILRESTMFGINGILASSYTLSRRPAFICLAILQAPQDKIKRPPKKINTFNTVVCPMSLNQTRAKLCRMLDTTSRSSIFPSAMLNLKKRNPKNSKNSAKVTDHWGANSRALLVGDKRQGNSSHQPMKVKKNQKGIFSPIKKL